MIFITIKLENLKKYDTTYIDIKTISSNGILIYLLYKVEFNEIS